MISLMKAIWRRIRRSKKVKINPKCKNKDKKRLDRQLPTYIPLMQPQPPSLTEELWQRYDWSCSHEYCSLSNDVENCRNYNNPSCAHSEEINLPITHSSIAQQPRNPYSRNICPQLITFMPVCTSTPTEATYESFQPAVPTQLPPFYRILDRHLTVPKFPPPPIPNEQTNDDTSTIMDKNEYFLWEIETARISKDNYTAFVDRGLDHYEEVILS
ncbi:hypothetical protein DICVIV_04301 [Dictyocaulus viviparus]|uniref:Uncharacterized protein n=1 Tax=Dictyocaulus viviparus TaxID=29172 RepID=A0A0D8Y0K2_DICVI|nr:hypothetical protein DICVIV_04301 [Dictyocaulus viviparus]